MERKLESVKDTALIVVVLGLATLVVCVGFLLTMSI